MYLRHLQIVEVHHFVALVAYIHVGISVFGCLYIRQYQCRRSTAGLRYANVALPSDTKLKRSSKNTTDRYALGLVPAALPASGATAVAKGTSLFSPEVMLEATPWCTGEVTAPPAIACVSESSRFDTRAVRRPGHLSTST